MGDGQLHFEPDIQGTIASTRARYLEWTAILGELIDNSFDAGATRVDITLNGRELTVEDDGDGCDDLGKMLTMGRHSKKSTTRLGRYGVGLKDAAWYVGGPTRIETRHAGKLRAIVLDWDRMSAWSSPEPRVESADGKRGTRIRFESMSKDRTFPHGQRLDSMLSELSFIYSPAIKHGRQIVFRRGKHEPVMLRRFELPTLTDVIDTTINVDGKSARVYAGIVPTGTDNPKPGLSYTHAFRVIKHCALGCGGRSPANISGFVVLGSGWTLSRNKDDLSAYHDELGDAVFGAIRDIVVKAEKQGMILRSAGLASDLTSMFRQMVRASTDENARAKRGPATNKTGGIDPTGTGGKHRRAAKTQAGSRFREVKAGHFRIEFKPLLDDKLCEVDLDGRVIWLADNHPWIVARRDAQDLHSLCGIAAVMFACRDVDSGTPLLPYLRDGSVSKTVEAAAGRLLAEQQQQTAGLKVVA